VKAYCKKLIDGCAVDGGFIMDAAVSFGCKTKMQAMFDFTKDYGSLLISTYALRQAEIKIPDGNSLQQTSAGLFCDIQSASQQSGWRDR
jgi:hypothetical protein